MNSLVKRKTKQVLSMALVLILAVALLPLSALPVQAAAATSNQTVNAAIDGMSLPNTAVFLDFRNRADIVGDVDINELMVEFPSLQAVYLDNTNVKSVMNLGSLASGAVTYTGTFASGDKTLVYGGASVEYLESQGALNVDDLLAAIKMNNSGTFSAIPSGLLVSSGTVSFNGGAPINVTAGGTISAADMAALPTGANTAEVIFGYAESVASMTIHVGVNVKRASYYLNPPQKQVYKGGTQDYILTKTDEAGNLVTLGNLSDYSFSYSATGVTLTSAISSGGKRITITAQVSSTAVSGQSGYIQVYGSSMNQLAQAELVVASNANLTGFELEEYNDGVVIRMIPDNSELFVIGGTAISSLDLNEALAYTKNTIYLFKDDLGNYIHASYKSQVSAAVNHGYSLHWDLVEVNDSSLSANPILGITFTSGYTSNTLCYNGAIDVNLTNESGSVLTQTYDFTSAAANPALGYEIFVVATDGVTGIGYSKADVEQWISDGTLTPVIQYEQDTTNPAIYTKTNAYDGVAQIIEGDVNDFIVAAYYESTGARFVLDVTSIAGWYDTNVLANDLFNVSSRLIGGSATFSGLIDASRMSGYSSVLQLSGGGVGETANLILVVDGAAASLELRVEMVAPEIVKYILAPSGYTQVPGTYPDYTTALAVEAFNMSGGLYDYNIVGAEPTPVAVGSSLDVKVVGVYNTQAIRETIASDWASAPAENITQSSEPVNVPISAGGADDHYQATVMTGGPGNSLVGDTITLTTQDPNNTNLIAELEMTIGAPEVIGTYSVYEDMQGNYYSNDPEMLAFQGANVVNALPGSTATPAGYLEAPMGTGFKQYVLPKFSNPDFYDPTAMDWREYRILVGDSTATPPSSYVVATPSGGTLAMTADAVPPVGRDYISWNNNAAVTGMMDANTYALDNTASGLNGQVQIVAGGGATYNISGSVSGDLPIETPFYSVAPVVVGVAVTEYDTATPALIGSAFANGAIIPLALGETRDYVLELEYSDNSTVAAPVSDAALAGIQIKQSASNLNVSYAAGTATPNEGIYSIQSNTDADSDVWFEYTYALNGVSISHDLNAIGGTARYELKISCDGAANIEGIYLVATDAAGKISGNSSGASLDDYAMSDRYSVYPVLVDSSYYLSHPAATSLPVAITYGEVLADSSMKFLDAGVFDVNSMSWTMTTISPAIVSGSLTTDVTGKIVFNFTALGEGVNHITCDVSGATFLSSSGYDALYTGGVTAFNALTTPSAPAYLDVAHIVDILQKNVVDIVPTPRSSSQVNLGNGYTVEIKYAISSSASANPSINDITVLATEKFGDVLPGMTGYTPGGVNMLDIVELPGSTSATYNYSVNAAISELTIYADQPGAYKLGLSTMNKSGVAAPSYPPQYQEVNFTVDPVLASAQTVRYLESNSLATVLGGMNWNTIAEAGGSYLDATALNSGVLKMATNISGTAATTVEVQNASGNTIMTIPVDLVGATAGTPALTRVTGSGSQAVFAPGETSPLMWAVTYTYNDGSGTLSAYENIDSVGWSLVQATDASQALTLSGDSITASGSVPGTMVYAATHYTGQTENFWAYLDTAAVAPTYDYCFSSNNSSLAALTSLTLVDDDPVETVYVWDNTAGAVTAVSGAISSDSTVATVTVSGNDVRITPVSVGATIVTVYPAAGGSVALNVNITGAAAITHTVDGKVIDSATGTPVSGATATLTGASGTYTASTDSNGDFAVLAVPDGTYTITVSAAGYAAYTGAAGAVVVNGADVSITPSIALSASVVTTYTVDGNVSDSSGPVLGASVTLTDTANTTITYTGTTDTLGDFTIMGVPDGTYTITISASGYNTYIDATGVTVSGGNETIGAITLTPTTVSGTVTDGAGTPLDNMIVDLIDSSGVIVDTITTDVNGDYTFTNVADDVYTATASDSNTPAAYVANNITVTVNGADVTSADIVLTPAPIGTDYYVSGTVTDGATGASISGAAVDLLDASGMPLVDVSGAPLAGIGATTNASGQYSIPTAVPDGATYTVETSATGYNTDSRNITVNGGNCTADIQLTEIAPITPTATLSLSPSSIKVGKTSTATVTTNDFAPGAALTYTWSCSDPTKATVAGTGTGTTAVITGVAAGSAAISCVISDGIITTPITVTETITVTSASSGGGSGGRSGSDATTYAITVKSALNGSVTANKSSAAAKATVTLTAKADEGYGLSEIKAVNVSGDSIALTKKNNGVYTFSMPASAVTVTATFKAEDATHGEGDATAGDGDATSHENCPSAPYTDVSTSAWYHKYADYVIENGYMVGVSSTSFASNVIVTRAQLVQILYNMGGTPAVSGGSSFGDVTAGKWYANAVIWAATNDIVKGYENGNFGPNDNITREQMAAVLYRYAQFKGKDVSASAPLDGYSDAGQVSAYAQSAMQWAVGLGLIEGRSGSTLVPRGTATRAEIATIITRFCGGE